MTPFMTGPDVEAVQRALGVEPDGEYGPITAAAVRAWQWKPGGYPKNRISDRLGVKGQAWLLGTVPLPAGYASRAELRVPFAELEPIRPLDTPLTSESEFGLVDAEGAPNAAGTRFHAGKDWFAPGGSLVRSPVAGLLFPLENQYSGAFSHDKTIAAFCERARGPGRIVVGSGGQGVQYLETVDGEG